ncbi:MAG: response regulator [Anaerolineaceae bacterium]
MNHAPILLVEDNPSDIELTIRALEKVRIKNDLVVAENGSEALDYLFGIGIYAGRDVRKLPAVVLLDLKLPGIDGLEVLKMIRLKSLTHRQPVIILTSSTEDSDLKTSYDLGVNSYIRKPVDFNEFTETIGHLITYWLGFNETPPVVNQA